MDDISFQHQEIPGKNEIRKLYEAVGWQAYLQEFERLLAGIENSLLVITARHQEELIGLLRAVGDKHTILYIQDILIKPEYQNQGIGSELLNRCLEHFPQVRQKIILTDSTTQLKNFYAKNGFTELTEESEVTAFVKFTN